MFLQRPLDGDWPYLGIDATYVKVRQAGKIVSVATIIAVAVNTECRREVLGLAIGPPLTYLTPASTTPFLAGSAGGHGSILNHIPRHSRRRHVAPAGRAHKPW